MDTEDSIPQAFKEYNNLLIKIKITWCPIVKWARMAWVYTTNVAETNKDR